MKEIIAYVRKKGQLIQAGKTVLRRKGQPRGVIVALAPDKIGWSFANVKSGDVFDKWKGIGMARTRAIHGAPAHSKIPRDVEKMLPRVMERAQRAFAPK